MITPYMLLIITSKTFIFKGSFMNNINEEKILGVTMDHKLTFSCHIKKYQLYQEYQTNLKDASSTKR